MMMSGISTHLPINEDMTLSRTVRQEHLQVPTATPRYEKHIRTDKSSISPSQTYPYDQNMGNRNITIQPKLPSFTRDTFRRENYLRVDIYASGHISDRLLGQLN